MRTEYKKEYRATDAEMRREQILLVEDHSINRAMVKKLLSGQYDILEAENGQIALDILKSDYRSIAGILLDLGMPVMDGLSFLNVYSQIKEYSGIPVIVTTAAQDEQQEQECLALGAWDFIRKPINGALLKLRLKNVLARSQSLQTEKIRYFLSTFLVYIHYVSE